MKRLLFLLGFLYLSSLQINAQQVQYLSSAGIHQALKKLNTVGCVLYVAAHPDDENTRLLSYLANERMFRTVYLSLTRGDGGQNLIGNEQGDELGIIRTQELLAARRIDGAEQYFTSAVDFGYSKSPEETFNKWDREKVLADVVWAIRKFRPDVIITRFPTTGEGGHGHHTASAILAEEAFKAAADPKRFPEQLTHVKIWQAKRLLLNSFIPRGQQTPDLTGQIKLDVGGYSRLLGKSYGEMAADSRSMHKSQGFGVPRTRGPQIEYFKKLDGDTTIGEILAGINPMWARLDGSEEVQRWVNEAVDYYNPSNPEYTVPALVKVYKALDSIKDSTWKERKKADVLELIRACMGLYLEADSKKGESAPGQEINMEITVNSRSFTGSRLERIVIGSRDTSAALKLKPNENFSWKLNYVIPKETPFSEPYWLSGPKNGNHYPGSRLISGAPENDAALSAFVEITVDSLPLRFQVPVTHKFTDPVKGEVYRPFAVVPLVSVKPVSPVVLFPKAGPQKLKVSIASLADSVSGILKPVLPKGWLSEPSAIEVRTGMAGTENIFAFQITPPANADLSKALVHQAIVSFESSGTTYQQNISRIRYDHIPAQFHLEEATVKLVTMEMATVAQKIGYLEGAGDDVAECLEAAGFEVTLLTDADIMEGDLGRFDAIITGIRAYNTNEKIGTYQPKLMQYVQNGGTLIVQYNTSNFLGTVRSDVGPYPFKISRDRVTEEQAAVTLLMKNHQALTYPNAISARDFEGWVQERGLYFATDVDSAYKKVLSMNDTGEKPSEGSLIIASFGKGNFVYTGLSFFRQLPAGVPGAYRLMSNLINLGSNHD